jgi:tRNA-2-methylthio-N6-dimethylallyladenosine synthase
MVFGPQTLHRLPEMITAVKHSGRAQCDISFPENDKFDALPAPKIEQATAFVSIMEGCSKYCSFCVVPYTRGEEISRPLVDIISELKTIASQGVKEVTLLGQNVNAYAGPRSDGQLVDFAYLLERTAEIEGIERIRFTTSHPLEMTDRLIQVIGKVPKLVNYLHLPVQSGSDRILMAMKRGYTRLEYKSIIRKVKAVRPDIALSSDFIVGFPGETEADFNDTLTLVKECGFDQSFSFIYSRRPGTPAASLVDDLTPEVKHQRLDRLQDLLNQQALVRSQALVGQVVKILVERPAKRNTDEIAGRTECNRWVNLKAPSDLIGQMIEVKITEAHPFSLRGEWVNAHGLVEYAS